MYVCVWGGGDRRANDIPRPSDGKACPGDCLTSAPSIPRNLTIPNSYNDHSPKTELVTTKQHISSCVGRFVTSATTLRPTLRESGMMSCTPPKTNTATLPEREQTTQNLDPIYYLTPTAGITQVSYLHPATLTEFSAKVWRPLLNFIFSQNECPLELHGLVDEGQRTLINKLIILTQENKAGVYVSENLAQVSARHLP